MNFKIYIIGKKIDKFFSDAVKEYEKRLTRYCKTQLIYIKNNETLQKKLSDKSYKIIISNNAELISSEELSDKINKLGISGNSDISIILGNENLNCDEKLSISAMDMNLGLQSVITYEQIYRSYRIINNEPYHK
ncbi:MAG: 23S rRNA (pseudouridine(1915)-N(3))-methyltransferase RlmH [Bacillota bacterium]|nr:23S rRNA (pseudouridine(1915)-N(3))-methyltransferase RlmH [Bacillota bacterium]